MSIEFRPNGDGTYDCYVIMGRMDTEFAADFMHGEKGQSLLGLIRRSKLAVRTVRFVLAGSLALAVPLAKVAAGEPEARYAMSYVYFGSSQTQANNVLRAKDTLSVVSPSYFDLNADGSLKRSNISRDFIRTMHQNGIRVVPFLSNHWDRTSGVNALSNVDRLAAQLVDAINDYGLDGVNVDIENVTEKQRTQYTELVRRLRESLPSDKEVSVAVAANPSGWNTGWHGSYDYAELGKYADHLFIMAYDEHYQGGAPGPVAGYSFVQRSIEYALRYVPSDKIVLGIPFFGRVWNSEGSVKGIGISNHQVDTLRTLYGGNVTYDKVSRSPKYTFTIREGDPSYTLVGTALPPGSYEVWFENSDSIKEKLALVGRYNLKGSGNWSAGQESPDVWEYYELWLNGKYFSDIHGHFAKDDIIRITADGIMKGVSASEFAPLDPLTRAQAAVIFSRLLSLPAGGEAAYSDIAGHWAEEQISAATAAGLFQGYDDNTFRPEAAVTREEISVLLARVLGAEERVRAVLSFPDVHMERWSYEEITALAELGIISGYEDGYFLPERAINRGEMAALVNRTRAHLPEDYLK